MKNFFKMLLSLPFYVLRVFRIKNDKILFMSYSGHGYGDNCRYIAENLINKDLDLVWIVCKKNKNIPEGIRQVKYHSIRWLYEMVTSRIWINNCRMPSYVRKRKGQYYIQVWHGGFMLKKIEFDASLPKSYVKVMKNDNRMIDLMLSNSEFNSNKCRTAFQYKGRIFKEGTPREQALIKNEARYSKKIRDIYNIKEDEIIILYAPTFRDHFNQNPYNIQFRQIKDVYEKKYKKKCNIMFRLHPNIKDRTDLISGQNELINVTEYPDMQELLAACDILITDYSSTMFEAMLINKQVIIYAADIDSYSRERGYYFTFKELPFPIAKNNSELKEIIAKRYDFKEYALFKRRLGIYDNRKCVEKVGGLIMNKLDIKDE